MDQRLLQYFNSELQYFRGMGSEFAKAFPKVAGRLSLDEFECADPYVERLLEGFAFLAARVQMKMDDEFPRLTQHLFEMVYPEYLSPLPSMAIVQFQPDRGAGSLDEGFHLPRGTALRSLIGDEEQTACQFSTAHPVVLWPLEVAAADYFSRETVRVSLPPQVSGARGGVRIELRTTSEITFDELPCRELDFYLHGNMEDSNRLYEQIFANATGVGVRKKGSDEWLGWLQPDCLRPVGFSDDEALLPCRARSFQGYRLLKEYFRFQRRFQFVRISGLQTLLRRCPARELELVILFDRIDRVIEHSIDHSNFALNCTPVINLFTRRAERIHIDPSRHEFHIVPDRTRPMDLEVFDVQQVTGLGANLEEIVEFLPFYGGGRRNADELGFYTLRRVPRVASTRQKRLGWRTNYLGSECYLALVDQHSAPVNPAIDQLDLVIRCTNRDLPLNMPLKRGKTDFTLETQAPVSAVTVLSGPTPPGPSLANQPGELMWRLINHLSLNYLSLADTDRQRGASSLRDLLRLYANAEEVAVQKQIDGVRYVSAEAITRRLPLPGPISFGRGLQITLSLDESNFQGSGVFLLGAVLARFFQRYVSINSFTETVLKTDERDEVMRWPPMIGTRKIL